MHRTVNEVFHRVNTTIPPGWKTNHTHHITNSSTGITEYYEPLPLFGPIAYTALIAIIGVTAVIIGITQVCYKAADARAAWALQGAQAAQAAQTAQAAQAAPIRTSASTQSPLERVRTSETWKKAGRRFPWPERRRVDDVEMQRLQRTRRPYPPNGISSRRGGRQTNTTNVSSSSQASSSTTGRPTREAQAAVESGCSKVIPRQNHPRVDSPRPQSIPAPPYVAFPSLRREDPTRQYDRLGPRADRLPPPAYDQHQDDEVTLDLPAPGVRRPAGASDQLPAYESLTPLGSTPLPARNDEDNVSITDSEFFRRIRMHRDELD
jgi:hypothetical protein